MFLGRRSRQGGLNLGWTVLASLTTLTGGWTLPLNIADGDLLIFGHSLSVATIGGPTGGSQYYHSAPVGSQVLASSAYYYREDPDEGAGTAYSNSARVWYRPVMEADAGTYMAVSASVGLTRGTLFHIRPPAGGTLAYTSLVNGVVPLGTTVGFSAGVGAILAIAAYTAIGNTLAPFVNFDGAQPADVYGAPSSTLSNIFGFGGELQDPSVDRLVTTPASTSDAAHVAGYFSVA